MVLLTEKFEKELLSEKFAPISKNDMSTMALILENEENAINQMVSEGTVASDIQGFTNILLPLTRRVYPQLIANELLGVQPMTGPTGFIYAMKYRYTGTSHLVNGEVNISPAGRGQILVVASTAGMDKGVSITGTGDNGAFDVTVAYVEGNKVLVRHNDSVSSSSATIVPGDVLTVGSVDAAVTGAFSNEAGFKQILKGYTGPVSTATGEKLAGDMKEIGFTIERKSIEAVTRKLKGEYTLEMYQDLKSQHGMNADDELMGLMAQEMQMEMDREIVDFVNANATQTTDINIKNDNGRWEIENYRTLAIRISNEAREIGRLTRRGAGNILLVSPKVAVALETIGSFQTAPVSVSIDSVTPGLVVAGTFDNRYKVVVDQFAEAEYCTVLYKGTDRRDAMGFFAPYVPAAFQRVTHELSGQPAIILSQRYGLATNPLNPEHYARSFAVNFNGTTLA
jgi:hypothetical protein